MLHSDEHTTERDRGSTLILALVLMVIGGLIVIPTLTYASTVIKANRVGSEKNQSSETAKAGLRVALADPAGLYESCAGAGITIGVTLPQPNIDKQVTTTCYLIDEALEEEDATVRYGVATVEANSVVPAGGSGAVYPSSGNPVTNAWLADTTPESELDKIWLPNLPVHSFDQRGAAGYLMEAGYFDAAYSECRVYFPGTYQDPVTISGPTYFGSGVYYFESEITFTSGANAVAGNGAVQGCTTDQDAAFYAINGPTRHNLNGLGVVFIFGDDGRMVVQNDTGPDAVRLVMQERLANPEDPAQRSASGTSIMTVNGDTAGVDELLDVPGRIYVPRSLVGAETPVPASTQSYIASTLTSKPTAPTAPQNVVATPYKRAATVTWQAPVSDGLSQITGYLVTNDQDGATCSTTGELSCAMDGLNPGFNYKFTVVATNAVGNSPDAETPTSILPADTRPVMTVPASPAPASVTEFWLTANEITWTAPTNTGGAPITGYTAYEVNSGKTCTAAPTKRKCIISGLSLVTPREFEVTATNLKGESVETPSQIVPVGVGVGNPPPPTPDPPYVPGHPTPVVDFVFNGSAAVDVSIKGYISVPQGWVSIDVARRAASRSHRRAVCSPVASKRRASLRTSWSTG